VALITKDYYFSGITGSHLGERLRALAADSQLFTTYGAYVIRYASLPEGDCEQVVRWDALRDPIPGDAEDMGTPYFNVLASRLADEGTAQEYIQNLVVREATVLPFRASPHSRYRLKSLW